MYGREENLPLRQYYSGILLGVKRLIRTGEPLLATSIFVEACEQQNKKTYAACVLSVKVLLIFQIIKFLSYLFSGMNKNLIPPLLNHEVGMHHRYGTYMFS